MGEVVQATLMLRLLGMLNEGQARGYIAKETLALGRGGPKRMQDLATMSQPTILRGTGEL